MEKNYHKPKVGHTKQMLRKCVQTFREIAVRYYPRVIPEVASRKLRKLIREDPYMRQDLRRVGYKSTQRHLTLEQYESLIIHLGTPEEFAEYCTCVG